MTDELVTTAVEAGEYQPTEVTVQKEESGDKPELLSNREALEKAIEIHRSDDPVAKKQEVSKPQATTTTAAPEIEPPAGFSKEGIEAWKNKDIAGIQKEYKRIHDSRTQEISRAQTSEKRAIEQANRERQEAQTWRELGKMAAPYIEAQGMQGVTPQQAIMNALGLITAFQKSDPATAKAELKKIGIDLDKMPENNSNNSVPKEVLDEISALRKWKNDTESELENRKFQEVVHNYESAYKTLDSLKTRTGEKAFPDLLDEQFCSTDAGKQFHSELGSLTKDPIFVKGVLRRFPSADFATVCREAYIALGGKVAGAPVTVSTNNQDTNRKIRAAASSPGKPVPRADVSSLKGKLSNRAAAAKALEIHGWEN